MHYLMHTASVSPHIVWPTSEVQIMYNLETYSVKFRGSELEKLRRMVCVPQFHGMCAAISWYVCRNFIAFSEMIHPCHDLTCIQSIARQAARRRKYTHAHTHTHTHTHTHIHTHTHTHTHEGLELVIIACFENAQAESCCHETAFDACLRHCGKRL
jgi:hypothetical protein